MARAHSSHVARRIATPADGLAEGAELRFDVLVAHLVRRCGRCEGVLGGVRGARARASMRTGEGERWSGVFACTCVPRRRK